MAGTVAILLLLLSAAAGASQRSDAQLARDVRQGILAYSHFTIFDSVRADVNGGHVTLDGKVTLPHKREDLAAAVRAVPGVRDVRNRLEVLPVSARDDQLRFRIARGIYGNAAFRAYASMANPPIHIIVEHGRVTLEGVVHSSVDRSLAGSIAGAFDAVAVRNDLRMRGDGDGDLSR